MFAPAVVKVNGKMKATKKYEKSPSGWVALIPLTVLAGLLVLVIKCFGSDSIAGGSQIALLSAASVAVMLSMGLYGVSWSRLEGEIIENIRSSASAIIILLLIGSIAGTWMVSGVVPTLICYGLEVLHPSWFLAACCLICSAVSLMTGSSWTTIATIGVALMGIGRALGYEEGWIAGAIISGAYFGDKLSPLSDTTVLASSTVGVPLFTHIRYMLFTTIPSLVVALLVFLVASLSHEVEPQGDVHLFTEQLRETFHITPWLLLVPVITGFLIVRKLPAIVTLFVATLLAALAFPLFQPDLVAEVAGETGRGGFLVGFKGVLTAAFGPTAIDAGSEELNALISTRGMAGMMNTVWLILCAMSFGGVMTGSGMLAALTNSFVRWIRRPRVVVSATVGGGLFFNMATADQYISIILTGRLFRDLYRRLGLEERLLSRAVEDSATVTSVLIPWNSCGMTQATVLGVATFTYLPYCVFNYLSPLFSILVALLGYKIYRRRD